MTNPAEEWKIQETLIAAALAVVTYEYTPGINPVEQEAREDQLARAAWGLVRAVDRRPARDRPAGWDLDQETGDVTGDAAVDGGDVNGDENTEADFVTAFSADNDVDWARKASVYRKTAFDIGAALSTALNTAKTENERLTRYLNVARAEVQKLRADLERVRRERASDLPELVVLRAEIQHANTERNLTGAQNKGLRAELKLAHGERDAAQRRVEELRVQRDAARAAAHRAEERLRALGHLPDPGPGAYQCSTWCDDDCEARCHEWHEVAAARAHDPLRCEMRVEMQRMRARAAWPRTSNTEAT